MQGSSQFAVRTAISMAFPWSRSGLTESLILTPERGGTAMSTNGNCTRLLTGIPPLKHPLPDSCHKIRIHSLAAQAAQPRTPLPCLSHSARSSGQLQPSRHLMNQGYKSLITSHCLKISTVFPNKFAMYHKGAFPERIPTRPCFKRSRIRALQCTLFASLRD
jgi:hypothetical protein